MLNDKRHLFDENAFDTITVASAYFLGILFSDGCVCKTTGKRHLIALTSEDISLIEDFKGFMKSSNSIRKVPAVNGKSYYSISFSSRHLYETLSNLGCVERKSLVVGKPNIPERYYYPFLAGLFDGDGSISRNRRINSWKASIGTASKKMFDWLVSISDTLHIVYSCESRKLPSGRDFYVICFTGISCKEFLRVVYESLGKDVKALNRKHERYVEVINTRFRGPVLQEWEKDIIKASSNNTEAIRLIGIDSRNYGWTRCDRTIRDFRKSI